MINADNIIAHELIGLDVEITKKDNLVGPKLYGKIVFETKNMILLKTSFGIRGVPKAIIKKARFFLSEGGCFISGISLIGRPEDRISRIFELKKNG
ncbi:MAG TPA: ribonuclease P protein subunit [Nitrososphaeraceae archaeon]|jgi:RNase P/RNase MRP subunit p29|nr:ribonuclease P protein subunit [Nitrososphaeraceae archaeon]HZA68859.1 ribonuclease P protein subunit [Nitrososphaeraceae archaeon]